MSALNPLLGKLKLPGRVFQLPSKGLFYGPGILAETVRDGEIQVKPMSALTELKIRSADLLISAKILDEVCAECAPEVLKPSMMLSRDVDALFLFLVVSTYGAEKSVRANHFCSASDWADYTIGLDPILSNPRNGSLQHRESLFSCELPNNQIVKLKPVTFDDSIKIMNMRSELTALEMAGKSVMNDQIERVMMSDMMANIEAVIDITGDEKITINDRKMIEEWLRMLPKRYLDMLVSTATAASDWGFDFSASVKCKHCGEIFKYDIELNPINFFTG